MRPLFAFLTALVLIAPPASAEVIDAISIESREAGPGIRLRLAGPVHYLRHYPAERGEIVVVMLEALSAQAFGALPPVEEVKRSRATAGVPAFTARVSRDPACASAARPLCIILAFEAPVRYRIRLGADRRSLLVELLPKEGTP